MKPVIWSEVSQKQKNNYQHIYQQTYMGSRKMVLLNQPTGKKGGCRRRKRTCGHSGARRGWDKLRK